MRRSLFLFQRMKGEAMEETENKSIIEPFGDLLMRIESVADWLKNEAQSLLEPAGVARKDVSVRRYKASKAIRLQRRPTYLLRRI